MVKIPFPGADAALVVMVGLTVCDFASPRAGSIRIHHNSAVFAVLMMRSDRRRRPVVVIYPDAVADVSALSDILRIGVDVS